MLRSNQLSVGQRVRVKNTAAFSRNAIGTIVSFIPGANVYRVLRDNASSTVVFFPHELEPLSTNDSISSEISSYNQQIEILRGKIREVQSRCSHQYILYNASPRCVVCGREN